VTFAARILATAATDHVAYFDTTIDDDDLD
jgi:hypothetical protein